MLNFIASSDQKNQLEKADLHTMNEQSECSNVVWVVRTLLYGSTTELDIFGAG